jgi:hypothetical protein
MLSLMYIGLRVMFPSFLPDFNKFEFPQHIIESTQMSNFMKALPVEVDRHMTKLILAFGNFAKARQQTVLNSVIASNEFVFCSSLHSFVSKISCLTAAAIMKPNPGRSSKTSCETEFAERFE